MKTRLLVIVSSIAFCLHAHAQSPAGQTVPPDTSNRPNARPHSGIQSTGTGAQQVQVPATGGQPGMPQQTAQQVEDPAKAARRARKQARHEEKRQPGGNRHRFKEIQK